MHSNAIKQDSHQSQSYRLGGPHVGGVVRRSQAESTLDCQCHGSRLDAFGNVPTERT
jgi:hypothetical protein